MDDLISRQEAIYAVNTALFPKINTAKDAEKALRNLPSAQPEKRTEERTETHACDLISRQAAIDALNKIFPADPMRNDYTQGITCGAALATEYIKQLPSAQPEIIWCKDCKHWFDIDDGRQKHRMCADVYGDWYCADAERRTDEGPDR